MNSANCPTLPLAEVQSGAILAAPALGADGQVLMTAGSTLSAATLEKLAQHGVTSVTIEAPRDEAELQAAREALRLRLRHLFRGCTIEGERSPAGALHDAVLAYRLEALQ